MDFDSVIRRFESSHLSFKIVLQNMNVFIQFLKNLNEKTLPIVNLTKSRNSKTGTATFIFVEPDIFTILKTSDKKIQNMYLCWENKQIISKDIKVIFKNGKPFLLKVLLIFKNSKEWFEFFQFMTAYSKETGLSFTENPFTF